ncbi:hypothetical protein [Bifidobacterium oedipodis]|uniref:Histidine kinase n=1 Tax=Bifidobacterium oedipodis TaxID=2675322 RepID=A0A7Y0HR37_9BIFI|nr:hypothetical protein [Bifidobacterium sp. DSM 109957]NMM93600.1 hypothetical protein [Bifidobacterium sp. DSM 109957]
MVISNIAWHIRHRLSTLRQHPYMCLITVVVLLVMIWETATDSRPSYFFVPQCVLIASSLLLPRLSYWALISLPIIEILLPDSMGAPSLTGEVFAIAMLSYTTNNAISAAITVLMCATQALPALVPLNLQAFISLPPFAISFALAALGGCSLRWRESQIASQRRVAIVEEQNKAMLHDIDTADQLHDALTGQLSYIARMAQRQMRLDSTNTESWNLVNQSALTALDNVHRIIDQLGHSAQAAHDIDQTVMAMDERDTNNHARSSDPHALDVLRQQMQRHDDTLQSLGFKGSSSLLQTNVGSVSSRSLTLATGVLDELYGNITRHARGESQYTVSVMVNADSMEIVEFNPLPHTGDNPLPHSGHGLDAQRRILKRHGGKLTTDIDDNNWTVFVSIPLP